MEAMWTRFLPVARAIKDIIDTRELGDLVMLWVVDVTNDARIN